MMSRSAIGVLQNLNDDVLLHIFAVSRPERGLRSLSATCWWIRLASKPILFRRCVFVVRKPITEQFLPQSLWPLVRSLTLQDDCRDIGFANKDAYGEVCNFLCRALHEQTLRNALQSMSLLQSVVLTYVYSDEHALSWETFEAVFSVPHIREITISPFRLSPTYSPPPHALRTPTAALTSFTYKLFESRDRWIARGEPSEREALVLILERSYHTLRTLFLPIESAPFLTMSSHHWPHLRDLTLSGEFPTDLALPFISLLARMPELHILNLNFALLNGTGRQPIWPTGYAAWFPWPNLEELSVSFPDPSDQIFRYLPRSMRRLSLRCCPHRVISLWRVLGQISWRYPMPSASEMLQILRQCDFRNLDHLQLEYLADDADAELLRYISTAFPLLTFLELHRYRQPDRLDIPVTDICDAASLLKGLQVLRLHLDFPEAPTPIYVLGRGRNFVHHSEIAKFRDALMAKAETIAERFGRPIDCLSLLHYESTYAVWLPFRIGAVGQGESGVQAIYDQKRPLDQSVRPQWFD